MSFRVHITLAAWREIEEIVDWISAHDSPESASYELDRLLDAAQSVAELPNRGSRPGELPPGMAADYRQVYFKPYRVIYRVVEDTVVIYLIADGRRNLHALLHRRLISG